MFGDRKTEKEIETINHKRMREGDAGGGKEKGKKRKK